MEKINIPSTLQILKKSLPISINYFFDILPFTITLIIFKFSNNIELQVILGLSSAYYNIVFGFLCGIQDVIGIKCSKAYGEENPSKFWTKFFVFSLINLLLVILSIFLVFNTKEILIFAKLDILLINSMVPIIINILFAKLLENFNNLVKGILIAQNITHIFFYTNLISFSLFTLSAYITILKLNLKLTGFIISFYIKVISDFIFQLIFFFKFNKTKFYLPKISEIFSEFYKDLKYSMQILISLYGEWIGAEFLTYFATLTNKNSDINAWNFYVQIADYNYFISLGMLSIFRTYASAALGERNLKKFKKSWRKIFLTCLFLIFLVSFFCFVFSENLAKLFTSYQPTISICSKMIKLLILSAPLDYVYCTYSMLLRIIRLEKIQFYIGAIFFPILMAFFGWILCVYLQLGVLGLVYAWLIASFLICLVVVFIYYIRIGKFFDIVYEEMENDEEKKKLLV